MTTALRTRLSDFIEKIAPLEAPELSRLDTWDRPALLLADNLDTAAVPVIASRRPVAATPHAPAPVPVRADKFGPTPSVLPKRTAARVGAALATLSPLVIALGVFGGLLWR